VAQHFLGLIPHCNSAILERPSHPLLRYSPFGCSITNLLLLPENPTRQLGRLFDIACSFHNQSNEPYISSVFLAKFCGRGRCCPDGQKMISCTTCAGGCQSPQDERQQAMFIIIRWLIFFRGTVPFGLEGTLWILL